MKKDRYVALTPKGEQGRLLTKPFLLPRENLTINCDASRGTLSLRLLDASGRSLKPIGPIQSEPISGDMLAKEIRWPKSIASLRDTPVRLEVIVKNAAFFGFEFLSSPAKARNAG
jgi:hypothetical protein